MDFSVRLGVRGKALNSVIVFPVGYTLERNIAKRHSRCYFMFLCSRRLSEKSTKNKNSIFQQDKIKKINSGSNRIFARSFPTNIYTDH